MNKKTLYERYGHLVNFLNVIVPVQHRLNKENQHSLRCFRMRFKTDDEGNKLYDEAKVRCKKPAIVGSLYCRCHNKRADVIKGTDGVPASLGDENRKLYINAYDVELGSLMTAYLNDPKILDLKPELASLRVILNNYISKLCEPASGDKQSFLREIEETINNDDLSETEKYWEIVNKSLNEQTLSNGSAIDRINRCVTTISGVMEKLHKWENAGDYNLTPEGLKVFVRGLVDAINTVIKDDNIKNELREAIMSVGTVTKDKIPSFGEVIDAEIVK